MNAHCRSIEDWIVTDIDPFDTIDPRITEKARRLHRTKRWVFFPYGWWMEADRCWWSLTGGIIRCVARGRTAR